MKKRDFVYVGEPIPKIDKSNDAEFLLNFQKGLLQALVERKLLTVSQKEQVYEVLEKRSKCK